MIRISNKMAMVMLLAGVCSMKAAEDLSLAKGIVNDYMAQLGSTMDDERKKMQFDEYLFERGDEELASLMEAKKEYEIWQQTLLDDLGLGMRDKATFQEILHDKNSLFARLTPQAVQFFANLSYQAYRLDEALQDMEDTGLMANAAKTQSQINANNSAIKQLEAQIEKINNSVATRKGTAAINREEIERIFRDRGKNENIIATIQQASGIALVNMLEQEKGDIEQTNKELNKLLQLEISAQKLQRFLDFGTYMGVANESDKTGLAKKLEAKGIFFRHNGQASGFVAYSPEENTLYISIAGTKSWLDFFSDIQAWKAIVALSEGGDLLQNMKFHAGFANIFGKFYSQTSESAKRIIQPLCEDMKTRGAGPLKIISTGHSLGGALAIVYAAAIKKWAASRGCDVEIGSVTFGSPAIISASSEKALVERFTHGGSSGYGNIVNIRHNYDPVPRLAIHLSLPGIVIPFGLGMFVDRMGDVNVVPTINPHGMGNYMQGADIEFAKILKEIERFVLTAEGKDPVADLQNAIDRYNKPAQHENLGMLSLDEIKQAIEELDASILKKRKELNDFVAVNRAVFNSQAAVDLMNQHKDEIELTIGELQRMSDEFEKELEDQSKSSEEYEMFGAERNRLDRDVQLEKEKLAIMREVYATTLDVIKKQVSSWWEGMQKWLHGK